MIIIVIISILALTLLVQAVNTKLERKICPICAGVTLTWLWMILGIWLGFLSASKYELLTAVLMGASIGGIVTELKKILPNLRSSGKRSEASEKLKKDLKDCC